MESMKHGEHASGNGGHYLKLAWMIGLMFAAMFGLMYAMVDRLDNVLGNLNQFYMAALMTGAMVIIELLVMGRMYPKRRVNVGILAASLIVLVGSWFGIREQTAIGDRQFLRSMIPHHAGAILMCQKAAVNDARVRALCEDIVQSQQEEIRAMKALLAERDLD